MRLKKKSFRLSLLALAVLALIPMASLAQTFAATTGTDPVEMATRAREAHVDLPSHHRPLEKDQLFGRVRDGVYTVDGMVAKVHLNYDVNGARFLYLFVPGLGTAVVSEAPGKDEGKTEAQLHGNDLTFAAGDHRFKLTGVALANSKGHAPEHLYVHLDPAAWQLSRHAMLGFGDSPEAPYVWPGALPATAAPAHAEESEIPVPPVPVSLLPSTRTVKPAAPAASPASVAAAAPPAP